MGFAEQLLINKAVLKEVKKQRRNLITVWLDYAKAFDLVPHSSLFKALQLVKLSPKIIRLIEKISKNWATVVSLRSENETIISDKIKYAKGIYQGDSLSVMLFILALNPLSYLIKQLRLSSWSE